MVARAHLLDAYRLMNRRNAQALLTGRPDGPSPLRRNNLALVFGVLVSLVALAGTAIAAHHSPADALDRPGTLVIEQETGARYVRCGSHRLCPVLNYTSARLAAGGPGFRVRTASRHTLTGFSRGPSFGIQDAPDTLPDARDLVGGSWTACVTGTSAISLVLGPSIGHPLNGTATVPVTASGHPWLIQGGQRHPVTGQAPANPMPVPMSWLTALPIGASMPAPAVAAPNGPLCLSPFGLSAGGTLPTGAPLYLPPGSTAVVDSPSNGSHTYALLTDGRRYPLASASVLRLLGYTPGNAIAVPPAFLSPIPAGPALDRLPLP